MGSALISNRKDKKVSVAGLSTKNLTEMLKTCKPKNKSKIEKELSKRT